ncbi:helix-turn-helix domain-containing protein [Alcaligenaceae bacterium]|nr:helix-turn-helix domain-containing protein [Alcaligenaceae bacterium]
MSNSVPKFVPVRTACDIVGGINAMARALGVAPSAVHRWATGEQVVPHLRCVQIEGLTGGAVTRKQLRPDDWYEMWPELRGFD